MTISEVFLMIRDQGESMKKEIIEQRSNKKQGGGGQAACEQPEGGRQSFPGRGQS